MVKARAIGAKRQRWRKEAMVEKEEAERREVPELKMKR
jgi:hypothetical protein